MSSRNTTFKTTATNYVLHREDRKPIFCETYADALAQIDIKDGEEICTHWFNREASRVSDSSNQYSNWIAIYESEDDLKKDTNGNYSIAEIEQILE